MSYDKNRLILSIPNIAYGDPSLIGKDEWARLAKEHPENYKEAQRQIKAHQEAHPPKPTDEEKAATKQAAPDNKEAAKGEGK